LIKSTQKYYFPQSKYPDVKPLNADSSLWLISHAQVGSGNTPQEGNYVAFEYTGRKLPTVGSYGRVFRTTDAALARQLNKFAYNTHFAPVFRCDTPTVLQPALIEALKGMHVGDTVEVMSASWLAYGASRVTAVNGEEDLPANSPIIFTVALKEIAPDPKQRELDMVKSYVSSRPDFVPAKDSLGNELPGFYISYADTVPLDTAHHYAATGDSVFVKYAGYYLQDGFLLDTDIDSVAKSGWQMVTNDTTYYDYIFSATAENISTISAFHYALLRVAPGSWLEFVFTSDYGYGAVGNSGTTTRMVYPYTPLRFKIYVAKNNR
jgi:FKBP-type peptidyl-prolyl cis-trans isomerase